MKSSALIVLQLRRWTKTQWIGGCTSAGNTKTAPFTGHGSSQRASLIAPSCVLPLIPATRRRAHGHGGQRGGSPSCLAWIKSLAQGQCCGQAWRMGGALIFCLQMMTFTMAPKRTWRSCYLYWTMYTIYARSQVAGSRSIWC